MIAGKRACVNVNTSSPLINKGRSVMRKTRWSHSVYIRNADGDWRRFPLASAVYVVPPPVSREGDPQCRGGEGNDEYEKGGKTYAEREGVNRAKRCIPPTVGDPSPLLSPRRCARRKQVGRSLGAR